MTWKTYPSTKPGLRVRSIRSLQTVILPGDLPMPIRAFESIRKIVEDFFGGASFTLTREEMTPHEAEHDATVLVKRITTEAGTYHFVLRRDGLPFTETEIRIADEVAEAFHILFANRRNGDDIFYFRTALLS